MASASINDLDMYYETYGKGGTPLILIHGSLMSSDDFSPLIPELSKNRHVIVADLQGHGRTGDIDRPLDCRQMADDIAALIQYLGHKQVDVFGFSMGGGIALQLALHHPQLLRKIAIASSGFDKSGWYPEVLATVQYLEPEVLAGSPFEQAYKKLAPKPEDWPVLLKKLKELDVDSSQATPEQIKALTMPLLLIIGDSDNIRPDHMVKFFELLGGSVPGSLTGMPASQLAILPGAGHLDVMNRPEVPAFLVNFLDAPAAAKQ